ncbi:MAG: bifunctional oligoribonuclease/PAP phosphatase NrnA [Candidatus Firestonebacteria bacterium]
MESHNLKDIVKVFKRENNFLLSTHVHPDGDGIGASLALALGLRKLKKEVSIAFANSLPENYYFLPFDGLLKKIDLSNAGCNIGVAIECSDLNRLGDIKKVFKCVNQIINIDHHPGNTFFGDYNYIVSSACAVGEQIYDILKVLKIKFDKDIATCIYASILTDTGSFAYSNTTKRTHEIVVDLLNYDLIPSEIYKNIYEINSLGKIQLLGLAINSLEVSQDKKISWITLKNDAFKKTGAVYEDAEGIINYARSIKGVDVAISFTELDSNKIKLSFRSKKDEVDVSKIASLFNGGGHIRASGAQVKGKLKEVKEKVLKKVFEYVSKIKS